MADVKPHKVPESVFEVEFKLFDFMTMKQFVIILITAIFAAMFYFLLDKLASGFIKWLVILTIITIGLIIAFVKVQGEPFEVYVSNFILALVSPQRRVWKKETTVPRYLRDNQTTDTRQTVAKKQQVQKEFEQPKAPVTKEMIAKEIQEEQQPTKFDLIEEQYLKGEVPQFGAVYKAGEQPQTTTAPQETPQVQPQQEQSFLKEEIPSAAATLPTGILWGIVYDNENQPIPGVTVQVLDKNKTPIASMVTNQYGQFRSGGVLAQGVYDVIVNHPSLQFSPIEITVGRSPLEQLTLKPIVKKEPEAKPLENLPDAESITGAVDGQANMLSGEVVDQNRQPVSAVTITVKAKDGSIVRSLATNPLGQFFSSSQLQNGEYVVELEKEGYTFERYILNCTGQVLRPKRIIGRLANVYQ